MLRGLEREQDKGSGLKMVSRTNRGNRRATSHNTQNELINSSVRWSQTKCCGDTEEKVRKINWKKSLRNMSVVFIKRGRDEMGVSDSIQPLSSTMAGEVGRGGLVMPRGAWGTQKA